MALTLNGSANTIGGVAVGGLPDGTVDADTLASGTSFISYAIIGDQKSQNTVGGTFTQGAWRTRDLNTEWHDPDGIVSISSNKFTLQAGNYLIKFAANVYEVNGHQARIYDVTNTTAINPPSHTSYDQTSSGYHDGKAFGVCRVTPSGATEYRLEHYCNSTTSNNGFGIAANIGVEVYAIIEIYKES